MKKLAAILTVFCAFSSLSWAQNEKQEKKPDEQIIINKEFDEHGNIIAYDSTYIHQWSSDSTFNFNFDKDFLAGGFPDMEAVMKEFLNDSSLHSFSFPKNFGFPFEDEDLFNQFNFALPDSALFNGFSFDFDSLHNLQPFFKHPDVRDIQKQFEEHFEDFNFEDNAIPNELNDEQLKELKELQKKHQKEMEELKKKWEKGFN